MIMQIDITLKLEKREMDELYKKLTGVDYKTILQRVDLNKEIGMKY